jgi:tRNA pseudouridine38-40 synthase
LTRTIKLTLAYDGTEYVGWQRQAKGASIQGLVEGALARIEGREVAVVGAGRTDAGVHALGQVASASVETALDCLSLRRALNSMLPENVRVLLVEEAGAEFHARFSAISKTYRYQIFNGEVVSPFERRYVWHVSRPLDVESMARAASRLEGAHDFTAFQASGGLAAATVRTMTRSAIVRAGSLIVYEISGDGFFRHMVRTIVGSLVAIGSGARDEDWLLGALASRDRRHAGPTAPAHGLFLVRVEYR